MEAYFNFKLLTNDPDRRLNYTNTKFIFVTVLDFQETKQLI